MKIIPHVKRKIIILLIVFATLIFCAIYFSIDPETSRFMPRCLFHELTGRQCPGCGSQRMLHALLHGDIITAWHHNALLLCLLPLLPPMVYLEIFRDKYPRLYMRIHSIPVVMTLLVIILVWWIIRL